MSWLWWLPTSVVIIGLAVTAALTRSVERERARLAAAQDRWAAVAGRVAALRRSTAELGESRQTLDRR